MKRCPKCDFSFADFHHVCEFDGTELVDDQERLPVSPTASATATGYWSFFLRVVKSPLFLTGLAVMALLASALLIGYYDSANQSNSIAENHASPNSVVGPVLPAQASAQPPAQIETRAPSSTRSEIVNPKAADDFASMRGPPVMASRSRARFRSPALVRNQQSRSETALQKESKENARPKETKVAAMLKTAWHVLKKPFRF